MYFWWVKKENAVPFDAVAAQYDQSFTETLTGRYQREKVYQYLAQQGLCPGHLLELNCGTGADAIWWAQQGWKVMATDISIEMIAQVQMKIQKNDLAGMITPLQSDALQITQSLAEKGNLGRFDLLFSNFGGINCIAPNSLAGLSHQLRQLLAPGGKIIFVVMGRFCWWETLYFLGKGNLKAAFRRLSAKPVEARLNADTTIKTWYYSPGQMQQVFSDFHVEKVGPVGFWVPPSYLDPLMKRFPALLKILNRWEKLCRGKIWTYAADHYYIVWTVPPQ